MYECYKCSRSFFIVATFPSQVSSRQEELHKSSEKAKDDKTQECVIIINNIYAIKIRS